MEVSIIIPTYNRAFDLKETLDSTLKQTKLPKEIIIVDDSDNNESASLIKEIQENFNDKIMVKYIHNSGERGLTIARNIGLKFSTGDIILFLDDDIILEETYIENILNVYHYKSNALGVQGFIDSKYNKPIIDRSIIFFLQNMEKNGCRVLPSTENTYPYILTEIITCQWLSGANQSYRREIFEDFEFDENLKKYSFKEDMDFSYRIFKKYPGSLYMTPYAILMHKTSLKARTPNIKLVYMKEAYSFYFFYKNIDQIITNKFIFYWSRIGQIMICLLRRPSKSEILKIKYLIEAYILCIKHLQEIKEGDLKFLNETL